MVDRHPVIGGDGTRSLGVHQHGKLVAGATMSYGWVFAVNCKDERPSIARRSMGYRGSSHELPPGA